MQLNIVSSFQDETNKRRKKIIGYLYYDPLIIHMNLQKSKQKENINKQIKNKEK